MKTHKSDILGSFLYGLYYLECFVTKSILLSRELENRANDNSIR